MKEITIQTTIENIDTVIGDITRHSTPKVFFERGIKLFLMGFLLNFLRFGLPEVLGFLMSIAGSVLAGIHTNSKALKISMLLIRDLISVRARIIISCILYYTFVWGNACEPYI